MKDAPTERQGQFLAYIHHYSVVNGCAPAEADMQRFYSSVESALDELGALLRGKARELYPAFSERLAVVEQMTDGIGWGFHDFIAGVVGQLEEELGDAGANAE